MNYAEYVHLLFEQKSGNKVGNDSAENAKVLYREIFSHAQNEIRIFCTNLSAVVFDDDSVYESLRGALNRGVKFKIIIKMPPDTSRSLTELSDAKNVDNVKIWIKTAGEVTANGKEVNFAVMDGCGYRYEYDASKPCAVGCANDPVFAGKLTSLFDSIVSRAS